jgi:hypothetical protein
MGIVKEENDSCVFKCTGCGERQSQRFERKECAAEASCKGCGRFFREDVPKEKQQFKVLNIKCPRCGEIAAAPVRLKRRLTGIISSTDPDGVDPNTGYPLYYRTTFDGKPIWALNREHLQYLINYIEADLRETSDKRFIGKKTQSDHLPKFMKLAKNRDGISKALRRLQEK